MGRPHRPRPTRRTPLRAHSHRLSLRYLQRKAHVAEGRDTVQQPALEEMENGAPNPLNDPDYLYPGPKSARLRLQRCEDRGIRRQARAETGKVATISCGR